ncbi:MAG TPA: PAS domain-containing protein, partial [Acetobacteraceae bacterium]
SWNRGAQAVFGWSESEIRGQRLHCIYTPEDIAAGRPEAEMAQALREGRAADDRWHRRRNGERFWVSGELTPLRDELGQAVGYVKALRDCTRQKRDEAQLRRLNETLEVEVAQRTRERDRIWRNSPDLLAVMNADGMLLAVNPAWTRLLGHEAADLIGSPIADYLHPDDVASSMAALAFAASEPLRHLESRYRSGAGDWRWFAWSATPEEGLIYASGRDVTAERKLAAQAHLANEARLRLALDAGEMGAWEWQIGAAHAVWVYGMDALHGLSPEQAAAARTREGYLRHVHPEDRAMVSAILGRTLAAANDFSAEYRILRPDGQTRWVETRARILSDENGEPSRFSGVCMDITRRKRTEENLRFLAQASAELTGALDDGIMLQGLARLAVPTFADWCVIDLLREDGTLERVATVHADARQVQLAEQLHRRYPPDPGMPHGIWNILRSGRGEIIANMSDNLLEHAIQAPERLEAVRLLGLHSCLGVPLAAHGATMGVITFITAESGRIYGEEDLELALDLARRAATAM